MERSSGVDDGCMGPAVPVVCLSIPSAREDMAGGPRAVVPGTGESGAEVLLPAGLGSCTGLYVAVRGIGGGGAGAHVHMADSVAGTSIIQRRLCRSGDMWRCRQERAVKPSAQPTLVRTQHLPPPAKTARWLRKRGPAGRFLLVPSCVIVCRCRSCVAVVTDIWRTASGPKERSVEPLALPICARFVPLSGHQPAHLTGVCHASRAAGSSPFCSRWAAGSPCSCPRPWQAAGSARAISSRLQERWPSVRRPPPSGRLARCRGERYCARVWTPHQPRHHSAKVPGGPSQGLDLAEPVMYLSWTDMYLSCTCRIPAPRESA